MADINKDFGNRLLDLIKKEGLTQTAFASAMEIGLSTLNAHVKGQVPPSGLLLRYAEFFGVSAEYLLTGRSPWTGDVIVSGRTVREGTEAYRTIKELAEADEETVKRIRLILELIRGEAEEKKVKIEKKREAG